jgi:NADPH-dependent ferric siderophore reductase
MMNLLTKLFTSARGERRVQRVRHEIVRRDLEVARVALLSPNMRAVTFAGASLQGFVSASFDDHLKFMFTDAQGELVRRDYTPRHFDPVKLELTIEFALHGDGMASNWARQAAPGQRAVVAGPRGSMVVPTNYDWHVLAGDMTAMPAIFRRLEELPQGARATVVLQTDDAADRRNFQTTAQVDLHWVSSADALVSAIAALPWPAGEGYVWCAGEASAMAQLRHVLLEQKAHPREAMRVAAYWKQGAADFHEPHGG